VIDDSRSRSTAKVAGATLGGAVVGAGASLVAVVGDPSGFVGFAAILGAAFGGLGGLVGGTTGALLAARGDPPRARWVAPLAGGLGAAGTTAWLFAQIPSDLAVPGSICVGAAAAAVVTLVDRNRRIAKDHAG
jgi:hypothetical protein